MPRRLIDLSWEGLVICLQTSGLARMVLMAIVQQ